MTCKTLGDLGLTTPSRLHLCLVPPLYPFLPPPGARALSVLRPPPGMPVPHRARLHSSSRPRGGLRHLLREALLPSPTSVPLGPGAVNAPGLGVPGEQSTWEAACWGRRAWAAARTPGVSFLIQPKVQPSHTPSGPGSSRPHRACPRQTPRLGLTASSVSHAGGPAGGRGE